MADLRSHPEQDQEHEGASKSELLIEAARRDNTELLAEIIGSTPDEEELATLLNTTKTVMGNYIYHEAALRGNYDIIDALLDCTGFECDPISTREGDTPLHSAIRYINMQPSSPSFTEFSHSLISMMLEAGSDPRIRNKANLTPIQLVDPRNTALKAVLQDAMDVELLKGDFVEEEEGGEENEEGDEGSASDSDFDGEEYRREVERRKKGNGGKGSTS